LMDARYADGEGMSDEMVLSESMQLLVAGHETSSNGLSWLLYLLSIHPEALTRVREEVDAVLGDAPLSHADVYNFPFTTQIIQEGLRLYPPFWMVDRMAVNEDRVGDIIIPAGSMVIVYVYGAHHAKNRWENVEEFRPERFVKENEKLRTPFTYLPFGGGPRICIGNHYAMLQILMILSAMLRRYDFEIVAGQKIEERAMVILRPKNGIKMHFRQAVPANRDVALQR
jgi:cytochrome P450